MSLPGVIDLARNFKLHRELPYFDRLTRPNKERGAEPLDVNGLLETMDELGIAMTGVVANVSAVGVRRHGGGRVLDDNDVDTVAEALSVAPERFFGWAGLNPLGGMQTLRYLEHAVRDLGFKAAHVFPHWFVRPINDRVYYPIYAKCIELGIPIGIQVGIPGSPSQAKLTGTPTAVDDVLFDFPELTLLCMHLGHPWEREWIALARNYPNFHLVADSSPDLWPPAFLELFTTSSDYWDPTQRILWGTNTADQRNSLAKVAELDIPDAAREAFLGRNARRLFALDES